MLLDCIRWSYAVETLHSVIVLWRQCFLFQWAINFIRFKLNCHTWGAWQLRSWFWLISVGPRQARFKISQRFKAVYRIKVPLLWLSGCPKPFAWVLPPEESRLSIRMLAVPHYQWHNYADLRTKPSKQKSHCAFSFSVLTSPKYAAFCSITRAFRW